MWNGNTSNSFARQSPVPFASRLLQLAVPIKSEVRLVGSDVGGSGETARGEQERGAIIVRIIERRRRRRKRECFAVVQGQRNEPYRIQRVSFGISIAHTKYSWTDRDN